jgi:nucleolar protein 16
VFITPNSVLLSQCRITYSYESLGLVANLHPTLSGGVERPLGVIAINESSTDIEFAPEASSSNPAGPSGLRKGYGRIVRDADGKIVDVELAEEDEAAETIEHADRLVEDIPDPAKGKGLTEWVGIGGGPGAEKTHVVESKSVYRRQSAFPMLITIRTIATT